jgi:hypothetical protein
MANGIRQGASTRPKVGQRVRLTRKHQWAGERGTVVRFELVEMFPGEGPRPVARLDNGIECFIKNLCDWRPA